MFLPAKYLHQLKTLAKLITNEIIFLFLYFVCVSSSENITILGFPDYLNQEFTFKLALYAKETQRYLCFNDNWRLVGMVSILTYNLRIKLKSCGVLETVIHL